MVWDGGLNFGRVLANLTPKLLPVSMAFVPASWGMCRSIMMGRKEMRADVVHTRHTRMGTDLQLIIDLCISSFPESNHCEHLEGHSLVNWDLCQRIVWIFPVFKDHVIKYTCLNWLKIIFNCSLSVPSVNECGISFENRNQSSTKYKTKTEILFQIFIMILENYENSQKNKLIILKSK